MEKELYDISDVCSILNTTSRTLRFYEEKGIIASTKTIDSLRRHYTDEQICQIRNVLVLRALGLSLKSIQELIHQNTDLREAIISKRAEIYALIDARNREIELLNEALFALDAGKDIFGEDWHHSSEETEIRKLATICSDAIVSGDTDTLYKCMGERLKKYLPKEAYEEIRKDTIAPLGQFICFDKIEKDREFSNKVRIYFKFKKLGLKITLTFFEERIEGLWLGYYDSDLR